MLKRYYGIFLIITLMFILMPCSFAGDNNITDDTQVISEILHDSDLKIDDKVTDIHVDTKGSDYNDGSEANPVATISKALDISSNHSKIIIHEGIYKENNLNITKSLDIVSHGKVIIDAENSSRIFTVNAKTTDEVVLSGITFTNARAYQGGAVYIRNAITTIKDSIFINNTALTEGGAIYWNAPYGKLINTIVCDNYAREGAGVSWGGVNASEDIFGVKSDHGEIINCTFENNHLMQDDDACVGLSVYSDYVRVINSTFKNHNISYNSSFEVLYFNGDHSEVLGCLFVNNSMTMAGALGLDGNYAKCYNNIFINNTMSLDNSFGGAIGVQSENANIHDNIFISNGGKTGVGGAIFINTIETFSFNFINITNNVFNQNFAYYGGGIYTTGKSNMLSLRIKNNIFDGENSSDGAAIYLTDIYNPVIIENNNFTNLISQNSGIYATHCILDLSNNFVENFTSTNQGFIFTDGEIRSQVYLNFRDVIAAKGHPVTLIADLFDDMNNTISTKIISFTINGEKLTGNKGINNITSTFNTLGIYNISGSFNSPKINVENGILTVIKGANFNVSDVVNYGKNVDIKVKLTDDNNVSLSGKEIILNLDTLNYLLITDSKGEAQINLDLDYKTYDLIFTLNEEDYYKITSSCLLTVLPSIEASDMTRAFNSDYDFIAQFVKNDGSSLNNSEVTFIVNNKEFKVSTDEDGVAKLTKLPVGSYSISVNNPVTGDTLTRNLNIVKRIAGNSNINMYFGANKYYKVLVYGDDGKKVGSGEKVSFKINGKTYTRKTDSNGYASFKITFSAKTYTITATYKGVKVSNKIVVKPVLTAKNISKKKAKTIKFSAKLVNTNGKILKGKIIKFKFKGKIYKSKTSSKGVATVSLKNLKVGKFSITTTYGKSTIKNIITVKK